MNYKTPQNISIPSVDSLTRDLDRLKEALGIFRDVRMDLTGGCPYDLPSDLIMGLTDWNIGNDDGSIWDDGYSVVLVNLDVFLHVAALIEELWNHLPPYPAVDGKGRLSSETLSDLQKFFGWDDSY